MIKVRLENPTFSVISAFCDRIVYAYSLDEIILQLTRIEAIKLLLRQPTPVFKPECVLLDLSERLKSFNGMRIEII